MAQLILPYPDFQPNTKIISSQVDANNTAITNLLNGNLGPDNVAYPFLATGTLGADKSGTATSATQGYNSRDLILRGSGWDGAAAQDRDWILRQIITSSTAYRLAFLKKEGAFETLLASIDQAGALSVTGNLIVSGTGTHAFAGPVSVTNASTPKFVSNFDNAASGARVLEIQRQGAVRGVISIADVNDIAFNVATGAAGAEVFVESFRILNATGDIQVVKKLLHTGLGARVYNNANLSTANATVTILPFNSERWDTDAIHDVAANTTRLTCNTAGKYLITGNISFAANATGTRYAAVRLNGTTVVGYDQRAAVGGTSNTLITVATVYDLAVSDYVELMVGQDSGGALDVLYASAYSPEFSMIKVG